MAKFLACLLPMVVILFALLQDCNTAPNVKRSVDISKDDTSVNPPEKSIVKDDDEMMETADNIVFRPLFRYQKQSVQRQRVFRDRDGNISRSPTAKPSSSSEVGSENTSNQRSPPQYLAYDKKTGAYYPISRSSLYPDDYYRRHRS